MKVYITKFALVRGIYELEVRPSNTYPTMVIDQGNQLNVFHKPEWHEIKEDAIFRANEMRDKKIASIKKQLFKLKKIKFE